MMFGQLPLLKQLKAADSGERRDDVIAGVITAILLVPQGMAYALLAGLPAETGLYAAIVPPLLYALLGTSRSLAVGPVAVAALMVASALDQHAGTDMSARTTGAMILAAETGLILLLMGALRAGTLVSFISHPVISGFTTGAALLIMVGQLRHLLGVSGGSGSTVERLIALPAAFDSSNSVTLAYGAAALILLLLGRSPLVRLLQAIGVSDRSAALSSRAVPLIVIITLTTIAAILASDQRHAVAVVGTIPAGLPVLQTGFLFSGAWFELAPSALLIALIAYVESVSVAKALAARRRQRIDSNQELHALGAANLAAAFAGAMPVAGGFARSMVNFGAGARTQVAAIVTAGLVLLVTLFFTGWLYHLPDAVLAAIIIVAVAQLIDLNAIQSIWRYSRGDGVALLATAAGVLFAGVEAGLVLGVVLSLLIYLWRTGRPHIAVVGRVPGTEHFRNILRHQVAQLPHVLFIRPDENLYFANCPAVEEFILNRISDAGEIHHLVLVMTAVSHVDGTGLELLDSLEHDLASAGITLHMAEVKGPVMDRLKKTHLGKALLPARIFLSTEHAWEQLASAEARLRQKQERYDTWII